MKKTYHFMTGLPRSGSTVLSAILTQNPNVHASPQTDLLSMLYNLETSIANFESYKAGLSHQGFASVMHNMADTFYSHIDKPVIIDKNRGWGTPYNWDNLSPYVNAEGKVILTMRPILEVLASFVRVIKENQADGAQLPYLNDDLWVSNYREPTDAVVDGLMIPNGNIDKAIFSIANLVKNHRDRVLVIWYNDLVKNPEATLDSIYDFLGLARFKHDFYNIVAQDTHNDLLGYGLDGLHTIKKKLTKPTSKPQEFLSNYVIQKYGNALDFLSL